MPPAISPQTALVSVVIPTFNQAQYLPICLDAVWHQDYPNLEIIVVNAASPDNTADVLAEYCAAIKSQTVSFANRYDQGTDEVKRSRGPRYPSEGRDFKIITLEQDPGLSETYNVGLRAAQGKYVAAIVSDDIPHPQLISSLAQALEAGADFAYGDMLIVDDAGRVVRKFPMPDYDPRTCLADWYLMGSARMWRRSLHERVGWMDSKYRSAHDYDLILRFAMNGTRFVHVPQTLYSVRWHGPNRQNGSHAPQRVPLIYEESKEIALRARAWLAGKCACSCK